MLLLDEIMAAEHEQIDQVWQANSSGEGGRKRMKRGILAYRSAYPDIKWVPQQARQQPCCQGAGACITRGLATL